ncbi:50S ribosomal protein L18 [Geminocystis sp. NIES-3709]|uniref:50S ribosomal protein L18 n=1 Tax=Geminocystis sp. NIES-3709 TaxID=1617448 RepID=UPI0005FC6549|nr:50S ribosomal protein L18 [Geminocystis sp. NIES-3709]BAQ65779.1 LSU ribosomal protein L18p [Geminocystis sp. NIES-3709]
MTINRKDLVQRRHLRIRKKVTGTPERPRLAVFRSNLHIYAQVIDDVSQNTLVSASTIDKELKEKFANKSTSNSDASAEVGKLVAQRALAKGIDKVVFDRGGNLYHGRVKALADAARESGLNF